MSTEKIQTSVANPSPLGLLGFGMTTVLLNLHNANIIPLSIVILSMDSLSADHARSSPVSWNL